MHTITIHVEEDVYEAFKKGAEESGKSAASLIREAMADYKARRLGPRHSVLDRRPLSAGGPIKPITSEDDILGEMVDEKSDR